MPFQKLAGGSGHYLPALGEFRLQHLQDGMGPIHPGSHGDGLTNNNRLQKTDGEFRREGNLAVGEQAIRHGSIQK